MLREAGAIFAKRGFHAASMDEIAERVGVSKPVIYTAFGSKEALYFAYIESAGADLLDAMVAAAQLSRAGQVQERLHAGALAFFTFVDEHRDGYAVLFSELAARGGPFRREVSAIRRQIVALTKVLLDEVVEEAGEDGARLGGTEALAQAFVGAGESLANWWLENPDARVEDITGRLMNITWLGLDALLRGRAAPWPTGQ